MTSAGMAVRTTETAIAFRRPFTLSALDGRQPAGTYRMAVDEQEVPGLSFIAYQRMATMLHTPAMASPNKAHQVFLVDAAELAAALESDKRD